jgi:hypothetical protein
MADLIQDRESLGTVRDRLNTTITGLEVTDSKVATLQTASAKQVTSIALLLNNTVLTYTPGSSNSVTAGDIIQTRAESFSYQVAASGATDQHITTAGGVKLYVLSPDLRAFGAVGDGVADDTAEIQAAVSSGLKAIMGGGRTYLVSDTISGGSDITLMDMTLTAPALASSQYVLSFAGSDGTPQTLGSNYAEGVFGMTVPNGAAFTVGGWAFLASSEYWSAASSDNVTYGEYVQITAISGNDLTFGQSTLLKYQTTASATITPIALVENVTLERVNLIGPVSTGNQGGVLFDLCGNVSVSRMTSEDFDYAHIVFSRSVKSTVRDCMGSRTGVAEGLDYGVVVQRGCYDILVDGYRGDAMRHIITIGGSSGVSRHISAVNCRGSNLTDGGMDSHSAVHEHTFANNFLHFSDDADTTIDGIVVQGTAPIVTNNQIYNCKRHGVAWQPEALTAFGGRVSAVISGNRVEQQRNTGATSGVIVNPVSVTGLREITAVTISDNQCGGFREHTRIITSQGAAIRMVRITGGQCLLPTRGRSIHLNAANGDIDGVEISGGSYEVDNITTAAVIDLSGTATGTVRNFRIIGPHVKRNGAGTVGILLAYAVSGSETGTVFEGASVPYSVDANSSGLVLDRRQRGIYTHSVSTAYTVTPADEFIILNRAATVTLTLPTASAWQGRELTIKTIQAQAVDSASANVAPIGDSAAGTSILPATDGAWAHLRSDGTNWVIMQRG